MGLKFRPIMTSDLTQKKIYKVDMPWFSKIGTKQYFMLELYECMIDVRDTLDLSDPRFGYNDANNHTHSEITQLHVTRDAELRLSKYNQRPLWRGTKYPLF